MQIGSINNQVNMAVSQNTRHEFSSLKDKALDNKKTREVAQEFESLFIEQMFKEMKKTINKTNITGQDNTGKDIFEDMLYTEYAKQSSKIGGFGLAKMVEQSLNPQPQVRFY